MSDGAVFLFLSVAVTAALSFVAVMVWLGHRKKEREEFYRAETMKKIAESGSSAAAIEYLRETERIRQGEMRDGLKLTGLILLPVGIGLTGFLGSIAKPEDGALAMIGVIPLMLGAVLFLYGQFMSPRK